MKTDDASPDIETSPAAHRPAAWRACKRAFAEDLVRGAITALDPDAPPDELAAAADAAWRDGDRADFIAAARALRAAKALRPRRALKFARALFEAELPEEALDVLHDPGFASAEPSFEQARLSAQCWLRLGGLSRGREALSLAKALAETGAEMAEVRRMVAGLRQQTRARRPFGRRGTLAMARALIEMRQSEQACAVLQAWLEQAGEAAIANLDDVVECAFAAFRTARAGPATALLGAMTPLYLAQGEGDALRSALAALHGEADDAPAPLPSSDAASQKLHACLAAVLASARLWPSAIKRYRVTPNPDGLMRLVMCELARCVGRDVASRLDLSFRPPGPKPRVFDLFPFNGEFAMLELKLAEMGDWVDAFVIVEARRTFTGQPKPLHFQDRASAFDAYRDKIVYVPLDDFPPYVASAWAREFHQRDSAALGLAGRCSSEDIVIISDVDEIIREDAVTRFEGPLAGADLQTFRYFFNYEFVSARPVIKTVFARAKLLAHAGSSCLRIGTSQHYGHSVVPKAGWHFTSIAAPEALETKFRSFSHEEYGHLDRAYFVALMDQIRCEGLGPDCQRREIQDLPECVRSRADQLAEWLL